MRRQTVTIKLQESTAPDRGRLGAPLWRVCAAVAMFNTVTSPDILDIVPEHLVAPVRRASWRARVGSGVGGLLSLALNAAVAGWLAGVGWPRLPEAPSQAISVDLVDHVPEPSAGKAAGKAAATGRGDVAEPAKTEAPPSAPAPKPAEAAQPTPAAPVPPDRQAPATSKPVDDNPSSNPAAPPPPEHPDNNPEPQLVVVPAPPPAPDTQAEIRRKPVLAPTLPTATEPPKAGPAAAVPAVLSASRADEITPDVTPPPPKPAEPTAEEKRQADNTATLAALLPFGSSIAADPFRGQVSAEGQSRDDAYRGAVYGNFNKADDVIADARAKHLRGQAVVAFTLDDHGGLVSMRVAVSSGNPAVDAAALELIRRGAPYPPPPPGAPRSFSPAIGLGLDD